MPAKQNNNHANGQFHGTIGKKNLRVAALQARTRLTAKAKLNRLNGGGYKAVRERARLVRQLQPR